MILGGVYLKFPNLPVKSYFQKLSNVTNFTNLAKPINKQLPVVYMNYKPEQYIVECFLEAVKSNPDDAWAFVSKVYSPALDLDELNEILSSCAKFVKWIPKVTYIEDSKNCITRSIYIENPKQNMRRLLHLRMIKEPDHNGQWKICGVEQEECIRTQY